ncbi:aminoglycoside phosphotransferase [Pseudofrankia sp. EUN1h]|nr:aminoglycoside phosphotransferase [Pseudofrankia sp. EUN1h]
MTAVLRSVFAPDALRVVVEEAYGLVVEGCMLLRSFVNDVYEVRSVGGRHVLKIYCHGRRSNAEVAWELEFVAHLAAAGVPVARIVPLVGGQLVGELAAPEGPRPFALSEHVDGCKPEEPFDGTLHRDFGRLVARLHTAGDSFRAVRPGRGFILERMLDEPLAAVLSALRDQPETRDVVRRVAARARRQIVEHADGLDRGPCHGDVSLDNIRLTSGGLVIYDFDLAGDGWRASDLTGVRATPFWDAFAAGYTEVRPLGPRDLAVLPWLAVAGTVANLRFHLVDKPRFRGTESVDEGWAARELASLQAIADDLI